MSAPRNVPTQTFVDGVTAALDVTAKQILGLLGLTREPTKADFALVDAGGAWHEHDGCHNIPDLTRGRSSERCDEHRLFHEPDGDANYLCSRRKGHTGRHAAGSGTCIRAVWP